MTAPSPAPLPTAEFYEGIAETIDNISLRRDRATGNRIVLLTFNQLRAIERFQSFRSRFAKALKLIDEEGAIAIEPEGIKFIFGGPEGDDLQRVECKLVIDRDDHWDRLMRFMQRYAQANGMAYGESPQADGLS
ncbi:photosystem II reaction center protein Psb28 [Nodosilinea sp. LEGE 07298]|jgi:photosystem II Psb28-2 protein|uniref:photosystem II reaction center protein Psb28 n=1 Tax=Nodosilinea sp. LEGE 07298 TaxID=2777970 RepID=UPI00188032BA|nr:photosystem II reaction center protein Psb28 [Nodosilinea sp. LEGE 07298]MBE9112194.1 photosystem II reaction center protein Psb28 [Nodosilinea sp. LEGE 07298]